MHTKTRTIDDEVSRIVADLSQLPADSEEYSAAAKNLKTLCEARSCKSSSTISVDTIIMAATNIVGILLVLNYEQAHVITSKALSFVAKSVRS